MNNVYQVAAQKARTVWLQNLLLELLPQLNRDSIDYHTWFDSLIEFMEGRGLVEPTQQKDYLSDVRNAIKVLDPNHEALEVVDFDKETWTQINNRSSDRLAERKTKFIDDPDAIVNRASVLLGSYHWSEIAAGLAVVTGRRCTEVIKTAQFEYKTPYSVIFTGSLKRKGEPVECVFEIPTLCKSEKVIEAISSLRKYLGTELEQLSPRQVSRRYGQAVASKCDRYFSKLVPPREDKDNLYTHLFRAVYATIASYWYCPTTVPEIEFRAAIQGHYQILDEKNPQLRRSIAAGRNYFDYKISDGSGNIDGRLGIKLHLPDVEVLTQFQSSQAVEKPDKDLTSLKILDEAVLTTEANGVNNHSFKSNLNEAENSGTNDSRKKSYKLSTMNESTNSSIAIPSFFASRLTAISNKLGVSHSEAIQALFTWTEMGLSLAEQLSVEDLTPGAIFTAVEQLQSSSQQKSLVRANNLTNSMTTQGTGELAAIDRDSINQLCTAVRLLSETLTRERRDLNNQNHNSHSSNRNFSSVNKPETNDRDGESNNSSNQHRVKQKKVSSKESNQKNESEQSINQAIDIIMKFNNDESVPTEDKWHIGIGSLRKLTRRGDAVIRRVIESRKEEIEQHHSLYGLGKWHNARGKDYPSIDEVIDFEG